MQAFASKIIDARWPNKRTRPSEAQLAQTFLDYVRDAVRYRPDPPMTEFVKSPRYTLCLEGDGAFCIPVGDCDDLVCALGGLMIAYGMEVVVLRQIFADENADQHVLIAFRDDRGKWLAADPSSTDMPVGHRQEAAEEEFINPTDVDALGLRGKETDGTFVAVGHLPAGGQPRTGTVRVSRSTRLHLTGWLPADPGPRVVRFVRRDP